MKKYNLFSNYTNKKIKRISNRNYRTIKNKIISTYKDKNFFDGQRINGYGGYYYDGRWKKYAKKIITRYRLNNKSRILHINCEKGFIISDIKDELPGIKIYGTETSKYAINKSLKSVRKNIYYAKPTELPFTKNFFDFVLGIGVVYALSLTDIIRCLNEIKRVSRGKSFVNLASYDNMKDKVLFENWSLLGVSFFKEKEWIEVLKHTKYTGDYYFTNAKSLGLR